ncbi:response regulator [Alsobacter sp. KACC 23698]|uniref:Response regulator n=1 Tax=Alsobacter sp. KACC 23698 TaxID=3149229 RepID=A0AAU7JLD7_9HYPH
MSVPSFGNLRILHVEESPFVRRLVRGMLLQVGIRDVIDAATGYEALERLAEFRPSLIVMQWEAPEFSAAQVLDIIRDPSRVREINVPVVVTTQRPTRRLLDEAAERDVQHVLRKPFSPKMMWERIGHFYPDLNVADLDPRIDGKLKPKESMLLDGPAARETAAGSS